MTRPARVLGRRLLAGAAAAAFALLGADVRADAAGPCGTLVIPTGLGVGPPTAAGSLHPILSPGSLYDQESFNQLYRPMLWFQPDHTIDWSLSHASRIDVEDGGRVYLVTLKPIAWSDGAAVTADDLVYCFELMKALGPTFSGYDTGGMPKLFQAVEAEGPLTLRVTLTQPVNPEWFELSGLGQFYALPRHAWGRYSVDEQRSLQTDAGFLSVVDGPFRLVEFNSGRYEALAPNPSYAGPQAQVARLVIDFLQGTSPLEALRARARRRQPAVQRLRRGPRHPGARPGQAAAAVRLRVARRQHEEPRRAVPRRCACARGDRRRGQPGRGDPPGIPRQHRAGALSGAARAGDLPVGERQGGPLPHRLRSRPRARPARGGRVHAGAGRHPAEGWPAAGVDRPAQRRRHRPAGRVAGGAGEPARGRHPHEHPADAVQPDHRADGARALGVADRLDRLELPELSGHADQLRHRRGRELRTFQRSRDRCPAEAGPGPARTRGAVHAAGSPLRAAAVHHPAAGRLLPAGAPGVEGLGDALQANYLWALQKIHFSGARACDAQAAR